MSGGPQPTSSEIEQLALAEDDFGHELRVGQILLEANPEHSGTYTDPVTKKPRQFDYRCQLETPGFTLFMPVECKNLPLHSPLVVCGVRRALRESFHCLVQSRYLSAMGHSPTAIKVSGPDLFYKREEFVGKSLLRLAADRGNWKKLPDADVYDKWTQALSSASDLILRACLLGKTDRAAGAGAIMSAVLPAVVLPDSTLWQLEYEPNGELRGDAKPVDECSFFLDREIVVQTHLFSFQFVISHLHFFTLTGFQKFLSDMKLAQNPVNNAVRWEALFGGNAVA